MKNIGLMIGVSMISQDVFEATKNIESLNFKYVWNRTSQKASDFANKNNLVQVENLDEAINMSDINFIYITTANTTHYDLAKKSLLAGKNVLLEKPTVQFSKQWDELTKIAKDNNLLLMEALAHGFWEVFSYVDWAREQIIGNITHIEFNYAKFSSKPQEDLYHKDIWRSSMWDLGIYGIFWVTYFLGLPKEINSFLDYYNDNSKDYLDEKALVISKHEEGTSKIFSSKKYTAKQNCIIVGNNGYLEVMFDAKQIFIYDLSNKLVDSYDFPEINPYLGELKEFDDLLAKKELESNIISHDLSKNMLLFLEKVYEE